MLNLRKPESMPAEPVKPTQPRSILERYPMPDTGRAAAGQAMKPFDNPDSPTDFVIGRGTRLKGEIDARGDVIVEGEVEASIRYGELKVEQGGRITGDMALTETDPTDALTLTPSGDVTDQVSSRFQRSIPRSTDRPTT